MRALDIKTRGVYIALACDIERMMDEIISSLEVDNVNERKDFRRDKIMHLEMGKKVNRCMKSLEKYNASYSLQYSPQFKIMEELVEYRNVMAHGYSEYDKDEKEEKYIIYYNKEKNKIARYVIEPRKFIKNMKDFQESLLKLVDLIFLLAQERGREPT